MKLVIRAGLLSVFMLFTVTVNAEQSQDFGNYVVHFNALNTSFIPPEVAAGYNIQRSKSRALLNVVLLRKVMDNPGTPVRATVNARASNLAGQFRKIEMRQIAEAEKDGTLSAVYYIGELRISNQETFDFEIEVTPEGEDRVLLVKYRKQFYVE
jgi:hypothetical protein